MTLHIIAAAVLILCPLAHRFAPPHISSIRKIQRKGMTHEDQGSRSDQENGRAERLESFDAS